jgi:hypothetical protein
MNTPRAIIVAGIVAALIVALSASFLFRYEIIPGVGPSVTRLNRLTGSITHCRLKYEDAEVMTAPAAAPPKPAPAAAPPKELSDAEVSAPANDPWSAFRPKPAPADDWVKVPDAPKITVLHRFYSCEQE